MQTIMMSAKRGDVFVTDLDGYARTLGKFQVMGMRGRSLADKKAEPSNRSKMIGIADPFWRADCKLAFVHGQPLLPPICIWHGLSWVFLSISAWWHPQCLAPTGYEPLQDIDIMLVARTQVRRGRFQFAHDVAVESV